MRFEKDLSDLAHLGDEELPLAECALRIALSEYPSLDPAPWIARLDALAGRVKSLATGCSVEALLDALNTVLFVEEGFRGNSGAYYDPRNSYLNEVLERRTGIPITLSVVYLEVAWRLGLALHGVGFPGHFLVGFGSGASHVLIDPFHNGSRMSRDESRALLPAADGGEPLVDERFFSPVTRKQIVLRMLTNLKLIHLQRIDYSRAIGVINRILEVEPAAITEIRDRGLIRLQAGELNGAVRDLEAYLEVAHTGADRETAVQALGQARRALARYN